jgi:tetratricopeptide (TPR) repeat protein
MAVATMAQQPEQAAKLLQKGEYAEAKPLYQKLVKQSPANANYNYGYGVCCLQTGDAEAALPYLKKASDRKVIEAYRYLGQAYYATYHFSEAVESYESYIEWLEKKKQSTDQAETEMARMRQGARMIKGVENVIVIDSVVVDKAELLSAYSLSAGCGKLTMSQAEGCVDYENERGNKRIATAQHEGHLALTSSIRLLNKWSQPEVITSLTEEGDANYPFLLSDGVTLYYAATGGDSMGGYDLFMSRYDSDTDGYLRPEHLGMPFNSPYNDYMMAIDESANLGWFASDRYQPEGKVCVYIFVPNESKRVYDFEWTDEKKLITLASLRSIRATWSDEEQLADARQRLKELQSGIQGQQTPKDEFTFVVSDRLVYHQWSDFRSTEAKKAFNTYRHSVDDLTQLRQTLTAKRAQYEAGETSVAPSILDLENRAEQMTAELDTLANEVRRLELKK